MKNLRILFDFQLTHSAELLRQKNPKGLIFPIWSFAQSIQALTVRSAYQKLKKSQPKPIWLYSDRAYAAGDNAEAFFEYCVKSRPDIKHVFIINKNSPDAKRLQKLGSVVKVRSFEHKLLFLMADKYFLSHPEVYFTNPYGVKKSCYEDLMNIDLVFLQHGITQNDLSSWLAKDKMNFSLIITAAQKEYNSFLDAPYGYKPTNLVKCGFPRFDKLENRPANKIIIMPSWRQNLIGVEDHRTNLPGYNENFKHSEYFNFFNNLIHDTRVINSMQEHKITGEFFLHPSFEAQISDFKSNKIFKIMRPPYSYNQAFAEGNLLVTDYSSVAFDFGYLKKPVLYCQFDKQSVYSGNHIFTKNYISPETDGFGPVVYNYESAIHELLDFIKRNFKQTDKYKKHTDDFFFYHDRDNCRRLLAAVDKFDEEKTK